MGAFIVTLMRRAVDNGLENDLSTSGRVSYKIGRQNVRRETLLWILTILVRYGVNSPYFSLPTTAIMTSYVAGARADRGLRKFTSSVLHFMSQ